MRAQRGQKMNGFLTQTSVKRAQFQWIHIHTCIYFHYLTSFVGRNINNLRYADDTTLMAESEEELRRTFLMKVKEECEKVGLNLNIQKTKIMASSPITSWQIDRETVAYFILGGAPKSLQIVNAAIKLKDAYSLEGKL